VLLAEYFSGFKEMIRSSTQGTFLVYAGGSGDDHYNMGLKSGLMTIAETSGNADQLTAYGLGINRSTTFFITIEGRHLYAFDTASGQGVMQLDWFDPAHRIETVTLSDGTYSFDQIVSFMKVSPHYLGNYTWSSAVSSNLLVLPPGATGADVNEAIRFYKNYSIALESPSFAWTNIESGQSLTTGAGSYSGPVSYLDLQFLGTNGREAIAGTAFSDFINALGGDDAISAGLGDDVLDGGTGSNFLTGGAGHDVFFLDGRGGTTTWATITDWEAGEQLSLWGWRPGISHATWVNQAGAAGYQGVTMHADLDGNGSIDASVTWSGLIRTQLPTPLEFDGLLWFQ
jgi:Ca2+-binding RTX toxin-like protein